MKMQTGGGGGGGEGVERGGERKEEKLPAGEGNRVKGLKRGGGKPKNRGGQPVAARRRRNRGKEEQ